MSHTIQHILVAIVVIAAVAYAARAIYRSLRCRKHAPLGFSGCPLADNCRKEQKHHATK